MKNQNIRCDKSKSNRVENGRTYFFRARVNDEQETNDVNDEQETNDVNDDECSSSTSSITGKLVIDESYQDEHEAQIEKTFQVTCHRLNENNDYEQSSPSSSAICVTKSKSSSRRQTKSYNMSIYIKIQHILRRNKQLKKKIKYYKKHWIRKSTGDIAAYLLELGTTLSHDLHSKQQQKNKKMKKKNKKDKIEYIARVLNVNPDELYFSKHKTDITKTCRAVTKLIYPDRSQRATTQITDLPIHKRRAIHEYCRFVHRQPDAPTRSLDNTISNRSPTGSSTPVNCLSGSISISSGSFLGSIDEFRIYNRQLSNHEICVLANITFGDEIIDGLNVEEIRLEFIRDDGEGEQDR
ncbi:unnamed protein product [Rotaria sp. Silwood1]|nr:unnamed protein product [Rotaria sp. Silwood1]